MESINSSFLSLPKKIIFRVVSVILYAFVIFHFVIVGFKQFPDNPVQHEYKIQLSRYVDPFFSQAWTLFSPNPINSNMTLLIQFKYFSNNRNYTTEWIDVSEPINIERQKYFWSPAQRISKFLSSSMQNINDNYIQFFEYVKSDEILSKKDTATISKLYQSSMIKTFGHASIIQYSQFVAKQYFSKQKNTIPASLQIQYRIFNAKFPRFSKRNLDYYNLENYTFSELTSPFCSLKIHN